MVNLKTYSITTDITQGAVNVGKLHQEIEDGADITNFTGITTDGDSLTIQGDSFISEVNVDSIIQNHEVESLDELKERRYNEIDYKTGQLIALGFVYDSKTFSTSIHAQQNWAEIHSNVSEFPDPVEISTKDSDRYNLTHANVNSFWTAGKDYVKGHYDTGGALKKSVYDAIDKNAVDLVIDSRS